MKRWGVIGIAVILLAGCLGQEGKKRAEGRGCGDKGTEIRDERLKIKEEPGAAGDEGVGKGLGGKGLVGEESRNPDTEMERRMRELGMVDIREVDASVRVHLVYATAGNFVGKVLYRDIHKAFMLPETARRLVAAQKMLKALRPELSLMVYDAARPMSVQQEMWEQVKGTDKREYVSNPRNGGGLHNYGAALDLTIVDSAGIALPMGSEFDYFGDEARPDQEEEMIKQGRIILSYIHNRRLLRQVMVDAGFRMLPSEWWHFNLMSRQEARERLVVIE